jgi:lipopolysaccharide/colanic/teichoic acid biosynthesis glycosyltransferase
MMMTGRQTDIRHKRRRRLQILYIFTDILLVLLSFLFFIWIKPASRTYYLPLYYRPFLIFLVIWLVVSWIIGKYDLIKIKKPKDIYAYTFISNITITGIITSLIYFNNLFSYSRLIVFGTIILSTILELFTGYIFSAYKFAQPLREEDIPSAETKKKVFPPFAHKEFDREKTREKRKAQREFIIENKSKRLFNYLNRYVDVGDPHAVVFNTTKIANVETLADGYYNKMVNLHRANDIRYLNKFFETINERIPYGGLYISCVETKNIRKKRMLQRYIFPLNWISYSFDVFFTRIIPKLPLTKKIYYYITLGYERAIPHAEILGRLYSCGFDLVDEKYINEELYFIVRKVKEPSYDDNPTYGPLISLRRVGKNGRMFKVYKLRTMHAYAEYLQEYVYKKYNLQEGGKFKNDFRVTTSGKIFRKFWLDETPMFINLIAGDMKLVGVRPLSKHYFELYTEELREKRMKTKPGLIPPFYADMPKTLEEIMASEMRYLEAYEKYPFRTDIRYFFKAMWNILFKGARSN